MRALAFTAVLWLAAPAAALDVRALKPQGYVSDFANRIDPASRTQLERYAADLRARTGVEMAFVTLASLEGEPVEDTANLLFRTWGIGQKGKDEGVLLLLAIAERRSRLEVGYGLEPIVPDGAAGGILRSMRPALREDHFGDAFILAARAIGDRVLAAKGIDATTLATPQTARRRSKPSNDLSGLWPIIAMAGLFFFLSLVSGRRGHRRGGYGGGIWPMTGGGWHGSSGGGFGSGGFGGFGGGSSGGGGASSNW